MTLTQTNCLSPAPPHPLAVPYFRPSDHSQTRQGSVSTASPPPPPPPPSPSASIFSASISSPPVRAPIRHQSFQNIFLR